MTQLTTKPPCCTSRDENSLFTNRKITDEEQNSSSLPTNPDHVNVPNEMQHIPHPNAYMMLLKSQSQPQYQPNLSYDQAQTTTHQAAISFHKNDNYYYCPSPLSTHHHVNNNNHNIMWNHNHHITQMPQMPIPNLPPLHQHQHQHQHQRLAIPVQNVIHYTNNNINTSMKQHTQHTQHTQHNHETFTPTKKVTKPAIVTPNISIKNSPKTNSKPKFKGMKPISTVERNKQILAAGRKLKNFKEEYPAKGLPDGWIEHIHIRPPNNTNGNKIKNQVDRYWFTPKTCKKLRSRPEVKRFMTLLEVYHGDENTAYKHLKQQQGGGTGTGRRKQTGGKANGENNASFECTKKTNDNKDNNNFHIPTTTTTTTTTIQNEQQNCTTTNKTDKHTFATLVVQKDDVINNTSYNPITHCNDIPMYMTIVGADGPIIEI